MISWACLKFGRTSNALTSIQEAVVGGLQHVTGITPTIVLLQMDGKECVMDWGWKLGIYVYQCPIKSYDQFKIRVLKFDDY